MRIVFVSPTASGLFAEAPDYTGGAEVQQWLLARGLARRGHEVAFVVRARPGLRDTEGVRVVTADFPLAARTPVERMEGSRALWEALGRAGGDVYVQKGAGVLTLEVALFARVAGRRFVYVTASDEDWSAVAGVRPAARLRRAVFLQGVRLAGAIVTQTRHQQERAAGRSRPAAAVIREGIVAPGDDAAPKERALLWAATLRWFKRPGSLLDLAARLPDVPVWVAGGEWIADSPRDAEAVRAFRARAATLPNVRCLGLVPHDRLLDLHRRAAVLVNTSLFEGFPQTFLEAWAHGTPVVTLGVDPDEIICRHGLGYHTADDASLAGAVRRLLDDDGLRDRIGRQARAYVRAHHDLERTVDGYETLLTDVIRGS